MFSELRLFRLSVTSPVSISDYGLCIFDGYKLGNTTAYQYHPRFRDSITKITSPAPFNYETTFTYDADEGWLLTMTDALGRTTAYTYYDEGIKKGLKKTETDALGRITEYDYDNWGNIKWIKDPLERFHYYCYDQNGNLQKNTDIYGRTTTYYRDGNGNPIMIKDFEGDITRMEYDSLARLSKMTAPDGTVIRYSYDADGNTVTVTDSNGSTTRREFNEKGKVVREIDAKGYITSYEYDYYGNLIKITDPMLRERTWEYDGWGKLTKMTDPMGRETTYACNEYCSVNTTVDPNGWVTKYYYDVKCQLTKIEFHDGSFYQFTYDELGRKTAETGAGSLYGENVYGGVPFGEKSYGSFKYSDKIYYGFDPANTIFYEYDAGDRLIKISYPAPPNAPSLPGGAPAPRMDIGYEYFDDNKIRKITDVAGNDRVYSYDEKDRLASVTMCGKTVTYHYDDENYGRLDYIILPNGIKKEYIFNEDESMTGMKYTKNDGAVTLYRFDYVYGNNGNIIKQTITNPSGIQTVYNYNYDPIDRLVNVSKNNSEKTWYDFDPMGNRLKKKISGIVEKTENYDYNACDELRCMDETIFEFDMNGNMAKKIDPSEGTTEYTYNYNNRLFKINYPDNTESRNFYNSAGLRIKKTDKTGKTTYYYWDGTDIKNIPNAVSETDEDGNITNTLFPRIGFISVNNSNQWRFFIKDRLGSVIALTDENGNITDEYEYDEYGVLLTKTGDSHNTRYYIGQELDSDSGLIYLRARYYGSLSGKFTKRDPIGLKAGLNIYLYVKNNPISKKDISGNAATPAVTQAGLIGYFICRPKAEATAIQMIDEKFIRNVCCFPRISVPTTMDKLQHCSVGCQIYYCLLEHFVDPITAEIVCAIGFEFSDAGSTAGRADIFSDWQGVELAKQGKDCFADCCKTKFKRDNYEDFDPFRPY